MLTYLIILLDDTSVSYCHYESACNERHLITLDDLRCAIIWAMKENLNIQFVYPDYELPKKYSELINTVDHTKIKPNMQAQGAGVLVLSDWQHHVVPAVLGSTCVIRTTIEEMGNGLDGIMEIVNKAARLNIVLTDIESFKDDDIPVYKSFLEQLADRLCECYKNGKNVQLNILTDRLILSEMNNCGAGETNVTLAPNGKFYLCPAFYYEDTKQSVGNLKTGLDIINRQLLRLDHAPICRHCDAWQCKRCVWMNGRLTGDMNTPSHQQCVVAHLERNASRYLQMKLKEAGIRLTGSHPIEELTELDPFNIVNRWK